MLTDASIARAAMSEKYSIQTPFNIIPQLIGPYSWSRTSKMTLGDKLDMYFQDFSFVPLFLQVSLVLVTRITRDVTDAPFPSRRTISRTSRLDRAEHKRWTLTA